MTGITYEVTEKALASLFGIKDDEARTGPFRGLIGNLRRQGMAGGATGPGKAFAYSQAEIDIWLVALSFEKVGIPPKGVVQYINDHSERIAGLIRQARMAKDRRPNGQPVGDTCIVVEIDRLSPRWIPQRGHDMNITASFRLSRSGLDTVSEFLGRDGSGIILNLSAKLRAFDAALEAAYLAPLVATMSRRSLRTKPKTVVNVGK